MNRRDFISQSVRNVAAASALRQRTSFRENNTSAGKAGHRHWLPPVVAEADGVPIYAFGRIFVNGLCPDFETHVSLQEGNHRERVKLQPKKSWEIQENLIGITPEQAPRSYEMDFQPFLCINLIDGNPDTYWISRGQGQPDVQPEWIRIDLAKETPVTEVVLIPKRDGKGIPRELSIRLSKDAWHWETVYETKEQAPAQPGQPLHFPLKEKKSAKQIWIIGNNLPFLYPPDEPKNRKDPTQALGELHMDYKFALAEVQVIDEQGKNAALATRGAGVSVSSTFYGFFFEKEICDWVWPMHWDLGVKWLRINHWDWATLQWSYVEREKGKYHIDPVSDQAITEMTANGVKIIMALDYGNWLYAPEPRKNQARNIWNVPYDVPPLPVDPESLKGFCNYVRFMVRHFKDRVAYFEIWNEENGRPNYGFGDYKEYSKFVKAVVPVIREHAPDTSLLLGCTGGFDVGFLKGCLDEGVGPLVNAIGWHPYYSISLESPDYRDYPKHVLEFKKYAESKGFNGHYMATEWLWSAPYPSGAPGGRGAFTEIQKAKNAAQSVIMNLGLSVIPFWVDTFCDMTIHWDSGLFRNVFASNPINQTEPQPVYYVYRSLCTIMDRARPTSLKAKFSPSNLNLNNYAFEVPGEGWLLGFWLPGDSQDEHPGVRTDIVVDDPTVGSAVNKVFGIDTLNGFEQELDYQVQEGHLVIPNLLIRDYPLVVKLIRSNRSSL